MIGDMFNTKSARWVKVTDATAVCVMSSVFRLGETKIIRSDEEVVLLFSSVLRTEGDLSRQVIELEEQRDKLLDLFDYVINNLIDGRGDEIEAKHMRMRIKKILE